MMDVICRSCGGRYHETTDKYTSDVVCNGAMLHLKRHYVEYGWESFAEHASSGTGDLECPSCGSPYCADNGRVKTSGKEKTVRQPARTPIETKIAELYQAGHAPVDIAKQLDLGHYMFVIHRLKEMGLR